MKRMTDLTDWVLELTRSGGGLHRYELTSSSELVATLSFLDPVGYTSPCTMLAECAEGAWKLRWQGWVVRKVRMSEDASGEEVAVCTKSFGADGGDLSFFEGHKYEFDQLLMAPESQVQPDRKVSSRALNLLKGVLLETHFQIASEDRTPLVEFSWYSDGKTVKILPPARILAELPMLVLMGVYLCQTIKQKALPIPSITWSPS